MASKTRPAGTVSIKELAEYLDCSTRQCEKYCEEGLVIRVERGAYHLQSSIKNVVAHLRKQASNNVGSNNQNVADEAIKFKQTQRRLVELRVSKLEGTMISLPEVEDIWAALVAANRQLFLSIPGRIRQELSGMTGTEQKIITELCRDMLEETSLGLGGRPNLPKSSVLAEANATSTV